MKTTLFVAWGGKFVGVHQVLHKIHTPTGGSDFYAKEVCQINVFPTFLSEQLCIQGHLYLTDIT